MLLKIKIRLKGTFGLSMTECSRFHTSQPQKKSGASECVFFFRSELLNFDNNHWVGYQAKTYALKVER